MVEATILSPLGIAKSITTDATSNNSLNLFVKSFSYDDLLEKDIPAPSYVVKQNSGYCIGWFFDGYTHTAKGIEFKNDVLKKISLLLKATIKEYRPKNVKNYFYSGVVFNLNHFDDVQDLRTNAKSLNLLHSGDDAAFNVIRAEAYKMKREGVLNYDVLLDYSLKIIPELNIRKKSHSDIKSKVKNITSWTERFYNAGSKKRISTMSRKQAALNATTYRMNRTKDKVFNYISMILQMGTDLKKLSISFISKVIGVSWRTAKYYLTLYGALRDSSTFFKEHVPLIKQLKVIGIGNLKNSIKKVVWLTEIEHLTILDNAAKGYVPSFVDNQRRLM